MEAHLRLPRWLCQATARLLVAALSVTSLGPALHEVHDTACAPVVVLHDESQHHLQAAPTAPRSIDGDHCVACHFARSSRGPVSWEVTGLIALDAGLGLLPTDDRVAAALSVPPRPARAPPLA